MARFKHKGWLIVRVKLIRRLTTIKAYVRNYENMDNGNISLLHNCSINMMENYGIFLCPFLCVLIYTRIEKTIVDY